MSEEYKVSISGPGVNVERTVVEELANRLLVALVTGHVPALHGGGGKEQQGGGATDDVSESDSLAGFISGAQANTIPEKIAAIGAFLKKHEKRESFDRGVLESAFPNAGESVPKNLPRDLKLAVRAGWIAPRPGQKGSYFVTGAGVNAVGNRFEGSRKRKGGGTKRRKKKPSE
jgi:hypothetical protein